MKISINRTPEQVQMVRLMGSKNRSESYAAQEAFAAFIGPIVQTVIEQAPVISNLYKTLSYDENSQPSIPLDLFFDVKQTDFIRVWTQTQPGSLASSEIKGLQELMVTTYELHSAVSMLKQYLRAARLDVVAKTLERMTEEVLVKQEKAGANVLLSAVSQATYNKAGVQTPQILRAKTQGTFVLDDFNRLITLMSRVNASWAGGTPAGAPRTLTHAIGSPEWIQQIRAISYNPMFTNSTSNFPLAGPEKLRDEIYDSAGNYSIYGINLVQANEFGINFPYNKLFSTLVGSTQFEGYNQGANAAFSQGTEQVVVALNLNIDSLMRLVETSADTGATFTITPDDQYVLRQDKAGFFGRLKEGRVILDARGLAASVF